MTGLENIIKNIEADSKEKIAKLNAKAEYDAKQIIDAAGVEAEKVLSGYEQLAEAKANSVIERAMSADESAAKRAVLKKKQELIRMLIDAARDDIKNADVAEYFSFMENILNKNAKKDEGRVILSQKDMNEMTDSFRNVLKEKNLVAEVGNTKERNGFVIVYVGIEINCTVDAVFDAYAEEISDSLNAFLFGSEGGI